MQMSRNNLMTDTTNVYTPIDDVYADIKPSASAYNAVDEKDDMLLNIQSKLGAFSTTEPEIEDNFTNPDLMPTATTMRLGNQRTAEDIAVQKKVRAKVAVSTRTKVMISTYIIVVLALILAVTLCGVAISGTFAGIGSLKAQYSDRLIELSELQEIINADNYEELLEKATEMGFVQVDGSNSFQYTELETRPAQNINIQSNWFNDLCEWLSGIFGG